MTGMRSFSVRPCPIRRSILCAATATVSPWHMDSLVYAAEEQGATLALFGHTHKAEWKELGGVTLINPGTAGRGTVLTWALVTIFDNGAISCEFHELK